LNQILTEIVNNPWKMLQFFYINEAEFTSQMDSDVIYFNDCLNFLSKLKMEEQPRCKQKVNLIFQKMRKIKK